jgi:hypothetical protein
LTPSFSSSLARLANSSGVERVGGLVDEVARHVDPVGHRVERLEAFARGRGGRGQEAHLLEIRAIVLLLGLVAVEAVGAQAQP